MSVGGARYPDLEGMPVLITGGGSGIGAAVVAHFAAQGAHVAGLEDLEPLLLSRSPCVVVSP